jgi:hypothetical protein
MGRLQQERPPVSLEPLARRLGLDRAVATECVLWLVAEGAFVARP